MANQQRRSQITDAAIELFHSRGFYGTGMSDIAQQVGMSPSSLYNHFSSKQEVLAEIMLTTMQNLLLEHARALVEASNAPAEALRASVYTHVKFHAEHAAATKVTNHEINSLEEPSRAMVKQLRRDYVSRWVTLLNEGRRQGIFRVEDPKLTAYAIIDMGIGVALWFRPDGTHSAESLGSHYADFALRMVDYKEG